MFFARVEKLSLFYIFMIVFDAFFIVSNIGINPSPPDPGQREKINVNFYFRASLWCLKRFYEGLKAFINPFDEPQRSVKTKIYINFSFNTIF